MGERRCHAISSTARHKEAAWELIRFINSRRAAEIINESTRQLHESSRHRFFPDIHANRRIDEAALARCVDGNPVVTAGLREGARVRRSLIDASPFWPVTAVGQFMWSAHVLATASALRFSTSCHLPPRSAARR